MVQAELKPVTLVGRLLLTFVETSLLKKKTLQPRVFHYDLCSLFRIISL